MWDVDQRSPRLASFSLIIGLVDLVLSSLSVLLTLGLVLVYHRLPVKPGPWLVIWCGTAGFSGVSAGVLLLYRKRSAVGAAVLALAGVIGSTVCAALRINWSALPLYALALAALFAGMRVVHNLLYLAGLGIAWRSDVLR